MATKGPNTNAGKLAVHHNAVTHGITSDIPVLANESEDEWDQHFEGVIESLVPENYLQFTLAARAAQLLWRLGRVTRFERDTALASQDAVSYDLDRVLLDERERIAAQAARRDRLRWQDHHDVPNAIHERLQSTHSMPDAATVLRAPILRNWLLRTRVLPDGATLEKVSRYEAHLSKQLYQTLHELEAMQARSRGEHAPLARLDVTGMND